MKLTKKKIIHGLIYMILIAGMLIVVLPMIYMISTSLKPNGALYEYPPKFFPEWKEITLENYKLKLPTPHGVLNLEKSIL